MDVEKWQRRIEAAFTEAGVLGPYLHPVLVSEQSYRSYVEDTFHGYIVLTNSFLSFYVETLTTVEARLHELSVTLDAPWYVPLLLLHSANFSTFRGAENLLLWGYPFAGYGLLRDLKDRALILAGIASGFTTYQRMCGLDFLEGSARSLTKDDMPEVQKRRIRAEHEVFEKLIRAGSDLQEDHLRELNRWEQMFHQEVHGARLSSSVTGMRWVRGESSLPLLPEPKAQMIGMYLNRSHEIAWMILRTFPFLQLTANAFGPQWASKWAVLDDSFRTAIGALEGVGTRMAPAIIHLIDTKFKCWPQTTHYFEQ
jgi:hypothetical protein